MVEGRTAVALVKWYEVRGGDVVLGADGREWTVIRRFDLTFTLARPGAEPMTAAVGLDTDVTVVRRVDTSAEVAAAQVFVDAGFTVEILDEIAQLQKGE